MKLTTALLFSYAVDTIIGRGEKQASASISSTSSSVSSSSATAQSSTSTSNHGIQCAPLSEDDYAPTLDGIADEWTNVTVYELPLISASTSQPYSYGNGAVQMQCVYDDEKIYFVFHVPGRYRGGDSNEDGEEDGVEMHAAISTMFKIGDEASLSNMVSSWCACSRFERPKHYHVYLIYLLAHVTCLDRVIVPMPTIALRLSKPAKPTKLIGNY
jgi:hypothetical protein